MDSYFLVKTQLFSSMMKSSLPNNLMYLHDVLMDISFSPCDELS